MGGFRVDIEHAHRRNPFPQPVFVRGPVPGLRDPETEFTQHDHGYGKPLGSGDNLKCRRFVVSSGRQSIRIQNQRHVSGSIRSESSSIRRLIRAVSLRKCFSLPICFAHGFSAALASAASLSLTASVTNSRRGIPRSAALALARRKTVSGISSVVFTNKDSHIYGSKSMSLTAKQRDVAIIVVGRKNA